MLIKDGNGYAAVLQTTIPVSSDYVIITMSKVVNLGRVISLNAEFEIFINDD